MTKMTGGEALAKSLYREGVRVIFGLPGVQLYISLMGWQKNLGYVLLILGMSKLQPIWLMDIPGQEEE